MNSDNSTIKSIVEFGLDGIPPDYSVSVNLKDLLYINQVLGEYVRFFHQPMHYPALEDVEKFLGNTDSGGGFEVLKTAYYDKISKMFSSEIRTLLEDGDLDSPHYPEHYNIKQ